MKKHFKFLSITVITATVLLGACKKGEEDPFISLRSRKTRMSGGWEVTSFDTKQTSNTSSSSTSGSTSSSSTSTSTFDGTVLTQTGSSTSQNVTTQEPNGTGKATITYQFEKDGSVKMTRQTEITSEKTEIKPDYPSAGWTTTNVTTTTSTHNSTWTGTWNFLDGVGKQTKSRESIVINYTSGTTTDNSDVKTVSTYKSSSGLTQTYTSFTKSSDAETIVQSSTVPSEVWRLIELSSKKMQVESVFSTKVSGTGNSSYTDPSNYTVTNPTVLSTTETEGKTFMVLTAK